MKSLIFIIVLISLALCFADDEFFQKARSGDAAAVQRFLESGTHVSSRDSKGNTALVIAAGRGQEEVIKVLLQAGASVDESTENGIFEGINVLAWACSQGRRGAVVLLLQAGANPQHVQEKGVFHGKTPLMWASSQGRTEIVNLLISAGADVDLASQTGNFRGKTSLMWASSQGRLETVASLLQHGSNVNALDGDKMSALMWAAGTCYVLCFMYYMSLSCSKSLNSPNPCQNLTIALPLALLIYLFIYLFIIYPRTPIQCGTINHE